MTFSTQFYLSACIAAMLITQGVGLHFLKKSGCLSYCEIMAAEHGEWIDVCNEPGCEECEKCLESCQTGWQKKDESCYIASPTNSDYGGARKWCTDQGADLVTIHSPEENEFVLGLCGPSSSCWLGLEEVKSTGDKKTSQPEQQWTWVDGSDLSEYSNWKMWGGPFDEPNNWGGSPMTYDERYGFMNLAHNGFKGKWYDGPKGHQARAICKVGLGTFKIHMGMIPSGCPQGWTDFEGKCYIASDQKRNWAASESWCQQQGASLVSIHTAEENDIVQKTCGKRICWIGLSEKGGNAQTQQDDQSWHWNDGSDLSGFKNWKPWGGVNTEPNNWGSGGAMTGDEKKGFINGPWAGAESFKGYWYDGPGGADNFAFAVCAKPSPPPESFGGDFGPLQ